MRFFSEIRRMFFGTSKLEREAELLTALQERDHWRALADRPSTLTDEEREQLRGIAADLDERASYSRYQSEADSFREKADFLRTLAGKDQR